ncbi:DUF4304 domain-containing protein [Priestia megaterium]|uniref:DUF4304 domain-containing protein n=1 Tax=Priestia megaterium TaxID=1404 RepID=UPI0032EC255B
MRDRGFKGSFPHFYRELENRVDLLMFQFSAWRGVLYVEVSKCSPEVHIDVSETFYTPNKVKVYNKVPLLFCICSNTFKLFFNYRSW